MKTFIAALITLTFIITLMTINCIYIDNVMSELIMLSEAIPDFPDAHKSSVPEITLMQHYWEKHKFIICLTIGQKEIDAVDSLIIELTCSQRIQDEKAFLNSKLLITEGFIKIKKYEQLSLERIL